jgi:hypothetical protein
MQSCNTCELTKQVSDDDLKRIGLTNIIKYGELRKYGGLIHMLPEVGSYMIILIESKYNSGHWTCLYRKSRNLIYYFDSYGTGIDGELKYISPEERQRLGESEKILTEFVNNLPIGIRVQSNKVDYQKDSPNVATCGRHVMFFLMCMLKHDLTMTQYQKLIKSGVMQTGKSPDELICDLTDDYLS